MEVSQDMRAAAGEDVRDVVITARGLGKRYGDIEAVCGVDVEVLRGEIFAFLGPNGAGKTTTVEILEGLRPRTAGQVAVLGADPGRADRAWRNRVGIVLQESGVEPGLSVRECLDLYAGYYRAPRSVGETIELVGLATTANTRADKLSGGQRRRLDVALALIGDPELIFLDEPTTGFDPAARRAAWEVIGDLRGLGKTVFLTTHYLDEAEYLADRVAVIADGSIVATGTPYDLGGRDRHAATISFTLPSNIVFSDLPHELALQASHGPNGSVRIDSHTPLRHVGELAQWASGRRFDLPDLDVRRPSLEDIYLGLTERAGNNT